jgi:hypothetical protein
MTTDGPLPLRFGSSILIEVSFSEVDRRPFRVAHLEHIAALLSSGELRLAGATADGTTSVMLFDTTADAARFAVEADPYWQHGVWHGLHMRDFLHAITRTQSDP